MLEEIDDEEMTDSLFRLRGILLAKDSELENIAQKCDTFFYFQDLIKHWFKNDEVEVTRAELKAIWERVNN